MHYGPLSYFTLGRVFPRERLRHEPQRVGARRRFFYRNGPPTLVAGPYRTVAGQAITAGASAGICFGVIR